MVATIEIENIDELRLREGIDDVELHDDIRRLRVGDYVRLTFLSGMSLRETLLVRITSIRVGQFRGRLSTSKSRAPLPGLRPDALVTFTAGQIHSIVPARAVPAVGKNKQRH